MPKKYKVKMQQQKTKPLRLLIINQNFYPDFEAVGQYMTELAEDIAKKGIEVTVLASRGKGSKGFELYEKVSVYRIFKNIFPKNNLLGRYINYILLFISFFLKALFLPKPDIILFTSCPPFLSFIAILLGKIRHAKLVYCIQDLFPDVAVELGLLKNRQVVKILDSLTRFSYQISDKIIVIGAYMEERIIKKGVDPKKIVLIHNWADTDALFPISKNQTLFYKQNKAVLGDKFIIQYSGNMGMAHEFTTILNAAEKLQTTHSDILFKFIGGGVQERYVRQEAKNRRLKNIIFFPYQGKENLNQSLNACDIALVSMKAGFEGLIVPCKIYGILSVAKPVVFIGNEESEIGKMIKEENCGFVIKIDDVAELINSLLSVYNTSSKSHQMGQNGRNAIEKIYNRKLSVNKYYDTIVNICLDGKFIGGKR